MEAKIVPNELFYNNSITKKFNIFQEWEKLKSTSMKAVFNICAYPFLLQIQTKNELISTDYDASMSTKVSSIAIFTVLFNNFVYNLH